MKKIKRMCFFLIKGSFTLLHSGLSPLDPFSLFFKKKQPFSSLLSWLDMSFGRVSRAHDLRLWFKPRRTNKHKQLLSVPGLLSSPHSDAPLFFFFLSLSLCFSLYLCTVGGRQRKPHGLAFGMRRHDRQKEIERKCHDKKNKKKKAALKKTSPEEDLWGAFVSEIFESTSWTQKTKRNQLHAHWRFSLQSCGPT